MSQPPTSQPRTSQPPTSQPRTSQPPTSQARTSQARTSQAGRWSGRAARWFAAVRAAYALGLLCAPAPAVWLAQRAPADGRAEAVARVLGARHLAQAALTAARPDPGVLALGAGTDLAHAASMLALAAADQGRRRSALADAIMATAFAAAGTALAGTAGTRRASCRCQQR